MSNFAKALVKSLWPALLTLVVATLLFGQTTPPPLIQNPYGAYQPGVNVLSPSFSPPNVRNSYVPLGVTPDLFLPNLNSYVVMNQFGIPYLVVNPNQVSNPWVPTPILPGPIVPSPVVPNLNVTPNAPLSPGVVMPNPVFIGPNAIPAGPPIRMYDVPR